MPRFIVILAIIFFALGSCASSAIYWSGNLGQPISALPFLLCGTGLILLIIGPFVARKS